MNVVFYYVGKIKDDLPKVYINIIRIKHPNKTHYFNDLKLAVKVQKVRFTVNTLFILQLNN